jgi:hypothetical protein
VESGYRVILNNQVLGVELVVKGFESEQDFPRHTSSAGCDIVTMLAHDPPDARWELNFNRAATRADSPDDFEVYIVKRTPLSVRRAGGAGNAITLFTVSGDQLST